MARGQVAQLQLPDTGPSQSKHRVPDGLEHSSHKAISPLRYLNLNRCHLRGALQNPHRFKPPGPVFQNDFFPEPFKYLGGRSATHPRPVRLADAMTRMHELVGKFAVIRKYKHSLGIKIQTAHGLQMPVLGRKIIHHCPASLWIGLGRNHAPWLVEDQYGFLFGANELTSVDADEVNERVSFCSELRLHLAIHGHSTLDDRLFGFTTTEYSAFSNDLLET